MSPNDFPAAPLDLERDLLRYQLLSPLTVISARTQLLQRIAQQTPRLTELERTAILGGLAAILASAHELGSSLEPLIGQHGHLATSPLEKPR